MSRWTVLRIRASEFVLYICEWLERDLYMSGENRQLVTNEPVEFEFEPVDVQDRRKITDHFR